MLVAFIRPLAPAVGHIIVSGTQTDGYVKDAVALCGESTERMQVDVAVVCGDTLADVDCKRCLRMFKVVRAGGRIGIYFKTPLSDAMKIALRVEYVGAHPSPDGFNYRYREAQ